MQRVPKAGWYAGAAVALTALWAWKTGYLWPEPSLDPSPLAVRRGEAVMRSRCWSCHEMIPLAQRVAGWTPEYAYDAIGHLPDLRPAMPPFRGTDQDRADLAVYLAHLGATVPPPAEEAAAEEWQPPEFGPPPGAPPGAPPERSPPQGADR